MKLKHRVLITTSGVGSRLGQLTDYSNKSLVIVGDKPALAHIIELYPEDTQYVVTLGHFGEHVREFISLAYPKRNFDFVEVSPFTGPGSSLAVSMLQAKDLLQMPFIYHASDSIVIGHQIPLPTSNWVAGYKGTDATNYASFDVSFGQVTRFHDKGMVNFDFIHTGIVGVSDYKDFWKFLASEVIKSEGDQTLNDLSAFSKMLSDSLTIKVVELTNWKDIGNSNALQMARREFNSSITTLEKSDESIAFVDGKVIKFFSDEEKVKKRVERVSELKDLIPPFLGNTKHFFSYQFQEGSVAAKSNNPYQVLKLLNWASEKLWTAREDVTDSNFAATCKTFYVEKTLRRVDEFLTTRGVKDVTVNINGQLTPPLAILLPKVIDSLLSDNVQTRIHGDFILDNIIETLTDFIVIDWRQDFGGILHSGDLYYDLAKLNHSLYVSHDVIEEGHFTIRENTNEVVCHLLRKNTLVEMKPIFDSWIREQGYSVNKVNLLTAIIWLNMSPLHHYPFDHFLFYFGKYYLLKFLNDAI